MSQARMATLLARGQCRDALAVLVATRRLTAQQAADAIDVSRGVALDRLDRLVDECPDVICFRGRGGRPRQYQFRAWGGQR